jgi:hypothetical protein
MNTRIVSLSRFSAAACAVVIAAVSTWAFVSSTASVERDPFRFASTMAENAKLPIAQTAALHNQPPGGVLERPPACLSGCS